MARAPASGPPALEIENLTLTLPNGRVLLRGARLEVAPGALLLLVGPSGSGKSTLLNLIAGFLDPEDRSVKVQGHWRVSGGAEGTVGNVGLVFQNLALFDELSAVQNVQFAIDHRTGAAPGPEEARHRLQALGVPASGTVRELSAGERQRVAVARTLAIDPPVLLFDEPTTGLDPWRAVAVADLIAQVHADAGRTVIVVTHDFEPFLRHGPRLALLDPQQQTLRDVTPEQLDAFFAQPQQERAAEPRAPRAAGRGWSSRCLEDPGRVAGMMLLGALAPFGGWRHARWKGRYLWHYLRLVLLGSTALYVAIAGAMLGFVMLYFGFSQLPYAEVTLPLLTEELLAASGSSSFRVLVPLLTCVLVAGKCGAAVSADVGARRMTQQFEAMRSFGASPRNYLYGNIISALVLATPLLALIAYASSCYSALVAFLMVHQDGTVRLFLRHFFWDSWPAGKAVPYGCGWFFLKTSLCGAVIAGLSYAIGSRPKRTAIDVSRDVGLTIFWASLAVLAVHTIVAVVEF